MKTIKISIEDDRSENAVIAILDALGLDYKGAEFADETEQIKDNPYLTDKLNQGRKDMENGLGIPMAIENLWR